MSVYPGYYQWVRATEETSYGAYNSGGTVIWFRLAGDDAFNPQLVPAVTVIRSADAYNRRIQNFSNKYAITGTLKTPFYPTPAATVLGMAATTSGGPPPDLSSWTFDHFEGPTQRRYLGGVLGGLDVSSEAGTQEAQLSMNWVFQQVSSVTLAAPAITVFPSENPYLHTQLAGAFSYGSGPTLITQFDKFSLSIKNMLVFKWYEEPYISFCRLAGRDVDLATNLTYQDTSFRALYEAQTAMGALTATYTAGGHSCALNFETASIVSGRSVSRPLGGVMEQGLSIQAFYDTTAGTDFAFTAS